MRLPIRKPGKYARLKPDQYLTQAKYDELKAGLEKLKIRRPRAAEEVKRLAEMGDFSENAAYQIAKGRLRGMNQKILELAEQLKLAVIIKPAGPGGIVRLGARVPVFTDGRGKTFLILGSAGTDPSQGIISHKSPTGSGLMGRRAGDKIKIKIADKLIEYKIIKIE